MNEMKQPLPIPFELPHGQIPKRIQLLPKGSEIYGKDGRVWKVEDPYELARRSNEYMPLHCIDENHATDLKAGNGGAAPAFGWFSNITVEVTGGLWADVEWTERGIAALKSKDYRYLSPVFSVKNDGSVLVILRAALTNTPNLELVALNAAQTENADSEENSLHTLAKVLDLPDDCTLSDIIAVVRELKKMVKAVNSTVVSTLTQRVAHAEIQLNTLLKEQREKTGEYLVIEAIKQRKITPACKEAYIALCATEEGLEAVKNIIENAAPIITPSPAYLDSPPPYSTSTEALPEDSEFLQSVGYTAEQWEKIKNYAARI